MNVIVLIFCFLGYLNLVKAKGKEDNIDKLRRKFFYGGRLPFTTGASPLNALLKSAVKFPHDDQKLVYGNLDNLGITHDKTPQRILYTGFRKENNMLATILKSAKAQGFNINMDYPSVVIIQQKKLKSSSKGNELKDKTSKVMEFLKKIKNPAKYIDKRSENEISMKSAKKIRKKKEKILDRPGQVKLSLKPRIETLAERTKRIQDILNGRVPVLNTKSRKEDSSKERARKVKEFLNYLVTAKDKLSLDKKTKYIEDFLNNKVQVLTANDFLNNKHGYYYSTAPNSIDEKENNANEIFDKYSSEESAETNGHPNTRRAEKKKKYRERDSKYESEESDLSDISASSDYERNPGNPFTIHKNKYKQNWLWNHFMDGDHMNINPLGPPFANMGPSGVDLFFGRKWWYYNQDDYKPMG